MIALEAPPTVKSVAIVVAPTDPRPAAPERRARRSRRTVMLALAFIVLANAALGVIGEFSPRLKDPAYGDKYAALRRHLAARPGERLVLSLGSSRTLLGFHGQHTENDILSHTNERVIAFNFGTPAAGPITNLLYLRRLLNAGVKPDLLLLEVMPGLCADGQEQLTLTGERLCLSEVNTVEEYGFNPAAVRPAWRESAFLPWSKLRFPLLGRVVPSWLPWNLRFDWSRAADPHGWTTPPRQEVTAEERAEREGKAREEYAASLASVRPDGHAVRAIRAILADCRARGIPARVVFYPEGSSFRAMYPAGTGERFLEAVRALAVQFDAPLTDARGWLRDDQMYDGHHMFAAGAEALTSRLCTEVVAPALRRTP